MSGKKSTGRYVLYLIAGTVFTIYAIGIVHSRKHGEFPKSIWKTTVAVKRGFEFFVHKDHDSKHLSFSSLLSLSKKSQIEIGIYLMSKEWIDNGGINQDNSLCHLWTLKDGKDVISQVLYTPSHSSNGRPLFTYNTNESDYYSEFQKALNENGYKGIKKSEIEVGSEVASFYNSGLKSFVLCLIAKDPNSDAINYKMNFMDDDGYHELLRQAKEAGL